MDFIWPKKPNHTEVTFVPTRTTSGRKPTDEPSGPFPLTKREQHLRGHRLSPWPDAGVLPPAGARPKPSPPNPPHPLFMGLDLPGQPEGRASLSDTRMRPSLGGQVRVSLFCLSNAFTFYNPVPSSEPAPYS